MMHGMVGAVPTVALFVQLPVIYPSGQWSWQAMDHLKAAGEEFVYTAAELERVLFVAGLALAATFMRTASHPRFRLLARALGTDKALATWAWEYDAMRGAYVPEPAPMIMWPGKHYIGRTAV